MCVVFSTCVSMLHVFGDTDSCGTCACCKVFCLSVCMCGRGKKIKVCVADLQCQAIFSVCFQIVGVTVYTWKIKKK